MSQLAELLGVEPARFVAVQHVCSRDYKGWVVVTEGSAMQTTPTFPEVSDNKVRGPKKGGKRGK